MPGDASQPEVRPRNLRRILLDVGSTGFWQVVGKLAQVFGFLHAMNCLGDKNAGLSGNIMATAMMIQVILTLGIDVVAVRHVSAKTQPLKELVPLIFSSRLVLHGAVTLLWVLGTLLANLTPEATFAWLIGGLYFLVIGMNYQWYFQATSQMPTLSKIQTATTLAISAYFFLAFEDGEAAGSDLLVMAVGHGLVTLWVWLRVRQKTQTPMLTWSFAPGAWKLLKEGQANWLFLTAYNALTLFGLLLIPHLMLKDEGLAQVGVFRASNQLVLALQFVLGYIGYIFYPKIVVWRKERPLQFKGRVCQLAGAAWGCGLASALLVWLIGEPVFHWITKPEFHPAFQILPIMVLAKFVGMASGFLTWGLLADHRDWLAFRACALPVAITFFLHLIYVPTHGFVAAGWLYLVGEGLLFLSCGFALWRLKLRPQS